MSVVVDQPAGQASLYGENRGTVVVPNSKDWSTPLFGCTDEYCDSLDEWLCWPCFSCKLAVRMGECCLCVLPVRIKVRQHNGIKGSACTDCLLFSVCPPCALNQVYRELRIIHWARKSPPTPSLPAPERTGSQQGDHPQQNGIKSTDATVF